MSKPTPYKLVLIGNEDVGRLSITFRTIQNTFGPEHRAQIQPFYSKELNINNKNIKLQIWATDWSERYVSMSGMVYRGASGAFLVYDITKRYSFENLALWPDELRDRADPRVKIILLGNKCDEENEYNEFLGGEINVEILRRKVSYEEGRNFAKENDLVFYEVSAKTGENIVKIWTRMAELITEPSKDEDYERLSFLKPIAKLPEQNSDTGNWLVKKFFSLKKIFFCCKRKIKEGQKNSL